MTDGYNKPDSKTWHANQRCSGTFFPAMAAMDSKVGENRGLSPCSVCAGGEFPHNSEDAMRGYVRQCASYRTNDVWHAERRCMGNQFSDDERVDARDAAESGHRPCEMCAGGEWPHERAEAETE